MDPRLIEFLKMTAFPLAIMAVLLASATQVRAEPATPVFSVVQATTVLGDVVE